MVEIPDNCLDDLRADHLAEEVRELAYLKRRAVEAKAQVARLEGELADLRRAGKIMVKDNDRAYAANARLEGEKAALAAALEVEWTDNHNSICPKRVEGHKECLHPKPAVLSGTGEGRLPGGLDRDAIREGVKALNEGRITPWEDVKRELGLGGWLPPEVEKAREALRDAAQDAHSYFLDRHAFPRTKHSGSFADCPVEPCVRYRAALGELEVK